MMTDVAVIGVGMTRFGKYPATPVTETGREAVLAALADAGIAFRDVQAAYVGAAGQGMTPGTRVLGEVGLTGIPITTVENASASGSAAFREAYQMIASGECEIALAVGVGKMSRPMGALGADSEGAGVIKAQGPLPPAGVFALRARRRMHDLGTSIDHYAQVAVKNHRHGSLNPYAQFQNVVSLEEVHAARTVADPLTVLHCCPTGDGAAAAVLASRERAERLGVNPVITVAACVMRSELYHGPGAEEADITSLTARATYERAGIGPEDIDLVQIHDAFTVEEIEYYESLGFAAPGEGEKLIAEGATEIGGRIPFSTDGGLLARGHPIGPTGLAQVWETVTQLRGAAGQRQVEDARVGFLHMIGAGGVCFGTILTR
ncbi:MAG: thiolase family protein [Dehalococcoidia bacterium]